MFGRTEILIDYTINQELHIRLYLGPLKPFQVLGPSVHLDIYSALLEHRFVNGVLQLELPRG